MLNQHKLLNFPDYPSLEIIIKSVLDAWPDHEKHIALCLQDCSPDFLRRIDELARYSLILMDGNVQEWAQDYRWMCERFREEQFYFQRHKSYRLSTLQEAIDQVYNNDDYMSRYVKGILFSQIFWKNHAIAMDVFRTRFLPNNKEKYDHLEVGPGHGMFMVFAANDPRCGTLTGWDISPSSLDDTNEAMKKMGADRTINLEQNDIVTTKNNKNEQFDSIICSEVLEHTEEPQRALDNLRCILRPGGRLFLNIPVNSPAPDHIYLWKKTSDVRDMIEKHGFVIEEFIELPTTGKTLEQAIKYDLDISCVSIARKI